MTFHGFLLVIIRARFCRFCSLLAGDLPLFDLSAFFSFSGPSSAFRRLSSFFARSLHRLNKSNMSPSL
jgi:hypothetical protein